MKVRLFVASAAHKASAWLNAHKLYVFLFGALTAGLMMLAAWNYAANMPVAPRPSDTAVVVWSFLLLFAAADLYFTGPYQIYSLYAESEGILRRLIRFPLALCIGSGFVVVAYAVTHHGGGLLRPEYMPSSGIGYAIQTGTMFLFFWSLALVRLVTKQADPYSPVPTPAPPAPKRRLELVS